MQELQKHISALERQVGDQGRSPLFARLAALYLEADRPKDALKICDAGLANFPFYSTGHLIKGKALMALNMAGEARREFTVVRDWLPTNPTVSALLEGIPGSDDDLLTAPLQETTEAPVAGGPESAAPAESTPAEETASGGDSFGGDTPATASDQAASTAEERNVFGLPPEAPTTSPQEDAPADAFGGSPASDFGSMEGFGGGGETTTAEQAPADDMASGMDQFGGMGEAPTAAAEGEETFEAFAERMRSELGPADQVPVVDYLSSELAGAETTEAQEEPTETVTDEPSAPQTEEAFGDAFGGGEDDQTATEEPVSEPTETVTDEASAPQAEEAFGDAFGGGEDDQTATEEPVSEPTEPAEDPAPEATEEPVAEQGFEVAPDAEGPADSGFGGFEAPAEETSETVQDAAPEEPQSEETVAQDEDPFAGLTAAAEEQATEVPAEQPEESGSPFEGFSGPDFSGMPAAEEVPAEEQPTADQSGEFEGPPEEPPAAGNKIEQFAEKLQDAKRITPVIDLASKMSSSASSSEETAVGAGFVTPTLAEIYAKQGWYDDAINAYKALARTRPADQEKFLQRVAELEEQKKKEE